MQNKKYYSISEVTKLLNIHSHQLRYLERLLPNLTIHKIRNRRYYTRQDIEYLKGPYDNQEYIDRIAAYYLKGIP